MSEGEAAAQGRKVKNLGIDTALATPAVMELTIQDLNDLADKFRGVSTHNPQVTNLTIEDIRSLEDVFDHLKVAKAEVVLTGAQSTNLVPEVDPRALCNSSCCCCTPCCCCT